MPIAYVPIAIDGGGVPIAFVPIAIGGVGIANAMDAFVWRGCHCHGGVWMPIAYVSIAIARGGMPNAIDGHGVPLPLV